MALKVLVLGSSGLLGHKLLHVLGKDFETVGTLRAPWDDLQALLPLSKFVPGVSADDFDSVIGAINNHRPDVVINCIGIIKQLPEAKDPIKSIGINALFPHRVAAVCKAAGARFMHISTDCIFSGDKGNYTEEDTPDPPDLYGRTKFLGEVSADGCLTLRTSIIGQHLVKGHSLIEWFLNHPGPQVSGYTGAIYSGLPTVCLANVIKQLIVAHLNLSGLFQVSSQPISKFDLLQLVKRVYGLKVEVIPDPGLRCDRSLNSKRFTKVTGIAIPEWTQLVEQMFLDGKIYSQLRQTELIHSS